MPREKIYKCCICHKILTEHKPIRLTKELYGLHSRGGHYPVEHYDFCNDCYKTFDAWIRKYKEVKGESNI